MHPATLDLVGVTVPPAVAGEPAWPGAVACQDPASAAKSDFLASMSHELRTPLNAIIRFSELMVADAGDADPVTVPREWVDHIRNGGRHLVALINDVLDLSKVEAGRLEITKVRITAGRHGSNVHLAVEGTGSEIAPEDQPHVFEESRQVGDPSGCSRAATRPRSHAFSFGCG